MELLIHSKLVLRKPAALFVRKWVPLEDDVPKIREHQENFRIVICCPFFVEKVAEHFWMEHVPLHYHKK